MPGLVKEKKKLTVKIIKALHKRNILCDFSIDMLLR